MVGKAWDQPKYRTKHYAREDKITKSPLFTKSPFFIDRSISIINGGMKTGQYPKCIIVVNVMFLYVIRLILEKLENHIALSNLKYDSVNYLK